jgi:rubrerythrin
MNTAELHELLYQALETEKGGVRVYETALRCVLNATLKEEWQQYLEQTRRHVEVVEEVLRKLGLDPQTESPGREVVRHIGESLVKAMQVALKTGKP